MRDLGTISENFSRSGFKINGVRNESLHRYSYSAPFWCIVLVQDPFQHYWRLFVVSYILQAMSDGLADNPVE